MVLTSNLLVAQSNSDSLANEGASSSKVRHVKGGVVPAAIPRYQAAPYAIGDISNPVSAEEYVAFLNTMTFKDHSWYFSSYYESNYMATDQDWFRSPNATIRRTSKSSYYQYSVLAGHETDIIDSVSAMEVQTEFHRWRKNPTVQELRDYINDKCERLDEEALLIKNCHPYTSQGIWEQADLVGQVIRDLNDPLQCKVCDEWDRSVLNFSNKNNNKPLHTEIIEGMEYDRPSIIKWESL